MDFQEMFRRLDGYAGVRGFGGAFPNFHQADHGHGVVFGAVLIRPEFIESRDVLASELGNPETSEARFRAVNDYARNNGFSTGFPNFHQADYGNGVVYGVKLLKPDAVEIKDVLVSDLGNPADNEARFRAVNDYAGKNGYSTGFPNFHQADWGNGVVYGVVFFKPDVVQIVDVRKSELEGQTSQFPLVLRRHTELGHHRRMDTTVKVSETGRIDGITKTWTSAALEGFHGSVTVLFADADDSGDIFSNKANILFTTQPQTYGVDGVRVGDPSRTKTWSETVPPEILEKTKAIAIYHTTEKNIQRLEK